MTSRHSTPSIEGPLTRSRSLPHDDLDNPTRLEPIGNGRFRYTVSGGGGPVGEVVRFVEEGGRVVRVYVGDGFVERVR